MGKKKRTEWGRESESESVRVCDVAAISTGPVLSCPVFHAIPMGDHPVRPVPWEMYP